MYSSTILIILSGFLATSLQQSNKKEEEGYIYRRPSFGSNFGEGGDFQKPAMTLTNALPPSQDDDDCVCRSKRQIKEDKNKQLVLDFYRELFTEKNIQSIDKYIDGGYHNYIRHNPFVTSGRETFTSNFEKWFTAPWTTDVLRIGADGDLVFVHNRVDSPFFNKQLGAEKWVVIVDIFRIEDGKLREHWDVLQGVPPPEKTVNNYTMF